MKHLNISNFIYLDLNCPVRGILVYMNDQIPSRLLTGIDVPCDVQVLPIELNLKKTKWLLLPAYRPPSLNEKYFLHKLKHWQETVISPKIEEPRLRR